MRQGIQEEKTSLDFLDYNISWIQCHDIKLSGSRKKCGERSRSRREAPSRPWVHFCVVTHSLSLVSFFANTVLLLTARSFSGFSRKSEDRMVWLTELEVELYSFALIGFEGFKTGGTVLLDGTGVLSKDAALGSKACLCTEGVPNVLIIQCTNCSRAEQAPAKKIRMEETAESSEEGVIFVGKKTPALVDLTKEEEKPKISVSISLFLWICSPPEGWEKVEEDSAVDLINNAVALAKWDPLPQEAAKVLI